MLAMEACSGQTKMLILQIEILVPSTGWAKIHSVPLQYGRKWFIFQQKLRHFCGRLKSANQGQSAETIESICRYRKPTGPQTAPVISALANFRTLFPRYSSPSSGNRPPSLPLRWGEGGGGKARSSSGPASKRKKGTATLHWVVGWFAKGNISTQFLPFGKPSPSRAEKFQVEDAGLGRKTIMFNDRR